MKILAPVIFLALFLSTPVFGGQAAKPAPAPANRAYGAGHQPRFNSSRFVIRSKFSQPEEVGPKSYYPTKARLGRGAKKPAKAAGKKATRPVK